MNARQWHIGRGELLVLLAAAVWGVAFYFQKTAMDHIGPFLFLALRGAVAVLVLAPVAARECRAQQAALRSMLPIATVGGLTFVIAGSLQQFGLITASVTNTGLLTALYVLTTPFMYWVLERDKPEPMIWVCAAIALLGVWLLTGADLTTLSQGDVLVVAATLGWGALFVLNGKGAQVLPLTYVTVQFSVVAVIALLLALITEPIVWADVLAAGSSVLYVGVLSTAFTFGMMSLALRHVSAPRAALILSCEVVFAALAGFVLLDERLSLVGWFGAGLILLAIVLIRIRPQTEKNQAP